MISRKYRVPLALILRANPYVDVYNMQIGQEICVPVMHSPRVSGFRTIEDELMEDNNMPAQNMQPEEMNMEDSQDNNRMNMQSENDVTAEEDFIMEEEKEVYITDGEKSLGDVLKEFGVELEKFEEYNDLSQVLLADDVVLYFPKKV